MLMDGHSLTQLQDILFWLMLVAVAVTATSAVLIAGRHGFDLFGMSMIALATALGGGSARDLLLDRPVFWVENQTFLVVALAAGAATFFAARAFRFSVSLFLIPDAIGLATFSIAGTLKALSFGAPWLVASFMGVITGVVGGILRDMMCNETPIVFRSTIYATVSWGGGILFILLIRYGMDAAVAAIVAGLGIFATRMAAIRWGLSLPVFRARE
ncbi:MAG: trimeric intracellular cation channel family protein [Gammaproteobacteria bacterium]|nr:trimeric intracellular cation channel family protein [Gammaproteobacteria bacterium]